MVGTFLRAWLFVILFSVSAAQAKVPSSGEDPFPLQCVDFSGSWKADNGTKYKITQENCKHLTITMMWNNYTQDTISIVPDNRVRGIPGMEKSAIRNRWNSSRMGSIIESHRTWVDGINKVTEVVMYERASTGLLLETTYTTVECLTRPGPIERDYEQQVFRRVSGAPGEPVIGDKKRNKR